MQSSAAPKSLGLTSTQEIPQSTENLVVRKLWLPKFLYDSLPYFYFISGVCAFFATLYISEWFWVLPHYLLFSAACIHLGIFVLNRRHRKKSMRASKGEDAAL